MGLAILKVTPEFLVEMSKESKREFEVIVEKNALPDDAKIEHIRYDSATDSILIVLRSAAFSAKDETSARRLDPPLFRARYGA